MNIIEAVEAKREGKKVARNMLHGNFMGPRGKVPEESDDDMWYLLTIADLLACDWEIVE